MCIFDLEFLSNALSLLLCLAVSDSLSLFLCQTVTLTLSLLPSTPVLVCFCHNLLSQSWELALMFFIVFRLLILKPRPSVPACPASGVMERLGWGGRGLSWLLRTSCASLMLQLQASKFWGLGMGRREGGHLLPMLTSWAGRLSQETPDEWKPWVCTP